MSTHNPNAPRRVQLTMQRTRALGLSMLYVIGLIGQWAGVLTFVAGRAHAWLAVSLLSVVVFHTLYQRRIDRRLGVDVTPLWMALDVGLITWAMDLSGDFAGLWLVWYLANTAGAAFIGGRGAAVAVAVGNWVAYLFLLTIRGEITGIDHSLVAPCFRMLLLYSAAFVFLRGIADLRDRQLEIRQLVGVKNQQLEELRELNRTLDQRTKELVEANLRGQEASRAKGQFLANMSHELRTPLNSIIGFSEILVEKISDDLSPRYQKFLQNILTSGRHLLSLINDILDLSKIEAGKVELMFEAVSVVDVAHGVRSVMAGIAGQRQIDLELDLADDLPRIVADGPKVKQILYNLVSNAVKFSPEGSRVIIGARLRDPSRSPIDAETLELRVIDQGIGIDPENHRLIFDEFRQVDGAVTRSHGGTGLGLALVRRFVEMHGGRISLESEPGKGSTFRIHLPLDASSVLLHPESTDTFPTPFEPEPSADGSEIDVRRPEVLVVEDDEPFFRALSSDLEEAGYAPCWARHGEEALRWVRQRLSQGHPPAVITLDLVLPGIDGWEVLKALKSDPDTATIPVIIVSLVENHELGFALGAEDYFLKPLERRQFIDRLSALSLGEESQAHTVLVVDDDPQVHEMLEDALDDAGYRMLGAHGGREGLEMAQSERPSLVVLDLMMPEVNGFEVAAALADDPTTADIPVVILTAKDLTHLDRERLAGKVEGLLSKAPMDRGHLLRTIRDIDRRRRDQLNPRNSLDTKE